MVENRIDELRQRLERDPGSRLFAQLAEEHRKAGDHAEAIRVARAGLAAHPGYASARLTLGRALLESGDAGAAVAELAQVLREAPDNLLAGRFLGQALEMSGDLAGALQQYTLTLKMAPGDGQLESRISALRASAGSAVGVPAPARPAAGVPAPPPTGPMGAPPPPPVPSRAAVPAPPAAVPPPAPTIRLPPPARSVSSAVPSPALAAPHAPPASPAAEPADLAERTLMYVPPATLNVRAEETLRQAPAPAPPAPPAQPASAEAPVEASTLPRHPAVGATGLEGSMAVEDTTQPRGRAPAGAAPLGEITLPRRPAPDFSQHAGPGAEPTFAGEEGSEETLDPGAVSLVPGEEPAVPAPEGPASAASSPLEAASAPVAPQAPAPPRPVAPPVAAEAGWSTDTRALPAVRRDEVVAAPEAPLSSSTLAELYLRQGLTERAREVYRQVLADDPGNARARAGLRDLDAAVAQAGPVDERAARRATLQRTIAALESLLGALRRD